MSKYQLGHHKRHHYWVYGIAMVLVVGLVGGGVTLGRQMLQPNTQLSQSKPYIGYVPVSSTPTQAIQKSVFSMNLPTTWKSTAPPPIAYTVYSWKGSGDDDARRLDVYVDKLPSAMAVNHLLPLEGDGDLVTITGLVSDNCANFTDKSTESAATGTAPAKWSGVSFLCDLGNYERDVVGTGSAEGINTVTVTGPKTGPHRFFFVYTDNSANPDYTLFQTILKSFRVL